MTAPLVIAAFTIVVIALVWMVRHQARDERPVLLEPVLIPAPVPAPAALTLDALYRSQMNDWEVREQFNDQRPRFGHLVGANATPSVRRADTRRSLLAMNKEWSKARHD